MRIILDTNFLMAIPQFKIDVFSQLRGNEIFVLDSVITELKKISKGTGKNSVAARIALELLKRKDLKILKSKEEDTDLSLLAYSKRGYLIATQDKVLRDKLKKGGGKVIYIRQKKYVVFE